MTKLHPFVEHIKINKNVKKSKSARIVPAQNTKRCGNCQPRLQTGSQINYLERQSHWVQPQSLRRRHNATQKPQNHRSHLQQRKNGYNWSPVRVGMPNCQQKIRKNNIKDELSRQILRIQNPKRSGISRRKISYPPLKDVDRPHEPKRWFLLDPIHALTLPRTGLSTKTSKNGISDLRIRQNSNNRCQKFQIDIVVFWKYIQIGR